MGNSFTGKTSWLWQNSEKMLIILFLATFTFNVRKVFLTPYSFLNGTFNEYLTMSFSWADVLMIVTILIYTIKYILSQSKFDSSSLRGTPQEKTLKENTKGYLSSVIHCITNVSCETYFLLLFIGWCFISIIWSQYKPIAIYRCLTLLEVFLFLTIVYKNLASGIRFVRISLISIAINGFIQAIIGIIQFIYGHSLGLHFLGESIVSRETPGVAKLIIDGMKHIRAYGTFSHPNIMAGFLIIPLVIIIIEILSRWKPKLIKITMLPATENDSKFVARETNLSQISTSLILVFLSIIGSGFILTFSRSAFLGFFIVLLFLTYHFLPNIQQIKRYLASFLLIIIILAGSLYFFSRDTSLFSDQSLEERASYANVSREIISDNPLLGVGMGQFVLSEYNENTMLEGWRYQPVHNIYLLITSELGITGLALFLLFITFLLLRQSRRVRGDCLLTNDIYYCIIYSFLIMALFDHYFWDIKMGVLIFSLLVVFSLLRNRNMVMDYSENR